MEELNADIIHLLLKATAKESVLQICDNAFLFRDVQEFPAHVLQTTSEKFSLNNTESRQLLTEMRSLVKKVLFIYSPDGADFSSVFPVSLQKNLADLLKKIFNERLPGWREQTGNSLTFFPRLSDFDWRVDLKSASDTVHRMSVLTCILNLQIEEPVTQVGVRTEESSVTVELSRHTLDTMLDGLGKIRDQLSSVAAK